MWKCRLHTFPNNLQTVIFISDFACLQAINLTNSTTGDLVFMGGKEFYPVYAESSRWNTLLCKLGLIQKWSITFYSYKEYWKKIRSFLRRFFLFIDSAYFELPFLKLKCYDYSFHLSKIIFLLRYFVLHKVYLLHLSRISSSADHLKFKNKIKRRLLFLFRINLTMHCPFSHH